jgi:hypothetical protein
MRPLANEQTGKVETAMLIETRGQGGYILTVGSPPECHATGKTYQQWAGPALGQLATITPEERDILWLCARALDEVPVDEPTSNGPTGQGLKPGDDYNQRRPDWSQILAGWEGVHEQGDKCFWRHPGKADPGWSATTGLRSRSGNDLLCVFFSNAAPFEGANGTKPCTTYSKFAAFAVLSHGGDFDAAAKDLAAQ